MCVQNLDDSRGLAIRITYRISLRSSSLWEPRHPSLKVVRINSFLEMDTDKQQTPLPMLQILGSIQVRKLKSEAAQLVDSSRI